VPKIRFVEAKVNSGLPFPRLHLALDIIYPDDCASIRRANATGNRSSRGRSLVVHCDNADSHADSVCVLKTLSARIHVSIGRGLGFEEAQALAEG
jgi:hypothetical protein